MRLPTLCTEPDRLYFSGVIRSQIMLRVIVYDASRTIKPLSVGGLLYDPNLPRAIKMNFSVFTLTRHFCCLSSPQYPLINLSQKNYFAVLEFKDDGMSDASDTSSNVHTSPLHVHDLCYLRYIIPTGFILFRCIWVPHLHCGLRGMKRALGRSLWRGLLCYQIWKIGWRDESQYYLEG